MIYYYNSAKMNTSHELANRLSRLLAPHNVIDRTIVILCIGSDRSTGDSLGPLIGYKLSKHCPPGIAIYGTLTEPVHAINLEEILFEIENLYVNPFIIAIDAALGSKDHIGYITLGTGPLKPGLGVNKDLPCAGDLHITGIVNFSGMLDSLLLQTTRLSTVMELADVITYALLQALQTILTDDIISYA